MEDEPLIFIDSRTTGVGSGDDDFRSVTAFLSVHVTPPDEYVAVSVGFLSTVPEFLFVIFPAVSTVP